MNNKNLKSLKDRTKEERQTIAKKGAKASIKARQEKAHLKAFVDVVLNSDNLTKEEKNELKELGLNKEEFTTATYLIYTLVKKAKRGDIRALEKLLELTGEDTKSEQFNKTLELKKKELDIKEKELALRERKLSLGIDEEQDQVIIVTLDDDKNINVQQELKSRGLDNAKNIIVNDLPK